VPPPALSETDFDLTERSSERRNYGVSCLDEYERIDTGTGTHNLALSQSTPLSTEIVCDPGEGIERVL